MMLKFFKRMTFVVHGVFVVGYIFMSLYDLARSSIPTSSVGLVTINKC